LHGQGNKSDFLNDLLLLPFFNAFIGEYFWNNGVRYEGEYKDGKQHGQGNKSDLLILRLLNDLIGKYFWNKGDRYEGEWKDAM